jgi:hypothetical protein
MTTRIRSGRLLPATLLAVSGAAGAWTAYDGAPPYGYAPEGPADSGSGNQPPTEAYQRAPLPPYPMPPMDPYGFPGAPGGQPTQEQPPGGGAPAYPWQPGYGPTSPETGLALKQEMTDEAYILIIELNGEDPARIDVGARGNALLVTRGDTTEKSSSQSFDDGYGYQRSWSWSSGQSSRRLPVPPDADLGAMRREQDDEQIRIVIPRHRVQGDDTQRQ